MTESHVVSALRAKRVEESGHIADLERKLVKHRANLAHIDATIRVFSPSLDPDSIPPKRTYRRTRYFAKGELSRRVLSALRQADGKLMTTAAIARAVMTEKGFPIDEGALFDAVIGMALTVLRRLCKRNTITKSGTSRDAQWVFMPPLL